MDPVLSIIIPVYNVEQYVEKTLSSIYRCSSNCNIFEVIVVNDGTKDSSMTVVNSFVKIKNNIKVINQENQGLSCARNAGYSLASGKYIWFIDSDDWLDDGAVDRVIHLIQENPNVDIFVTPLIWAFNDTKRNFVEFCLRSDRILTGKKYLMENRPTGAIQRNIIRKETIEKFHITFLPGILHEDGLYGPQIYYSANSVMLLKQSLYFYRQSDTSIMHTRTIRSSYDLIKVHKALIYFLENHVKDVDKRWFRLFSIRMLEHAYEFSWHIHKSEPFNIFFKENKEYVRKECIKCLCIPSHKIIRIVALYFGPLTLHSFLLILNRTKRIFKKIYSWIY